jgi:aquaporin Z
MRPIPSAEEENPTAQQRKWAIIRLIVSQGQVIGGIWSIVLLVHSGITRLSLAFICATGLLSLASLVLFRFPAAKTKQSCAKKVVAEFLGTFALVFAGTGAIIINDVSGGAISHVGVALTFGLVVLAMIYAFGDISGAHLNPAVTLGFFVAHRFDAKLLLPYVLSQLLGAVTASVLLHLLFPAHSTLGATAPAGAALQSFVLELVLTFFLMLVILNVSTGAKEKGLTAGIAVGAVIGLEALFAGPICGASMNPARSLAPAAVSLHFDGLWIYLAAPLLGACLAVLACRCVQDQGCCCAAPKPSHSGGPP